MSRALDKEVLKFLSQGDPTQVYDDLSRLFNSARGDGLPLEIEILGKTHPLTTDVSFLIDENAVGIPKVRLFQAFSIAYSRFKELDTRAPPREDGQCLSEVLRPTAVLLLVDPEHLTAANARKRAILKNIQNGGDIKGCLGREKWFVDSLLTSRLHRHTKSPVLWSHRRWLLSQFQKNGLQMDIPLEIRTVILISGERHPKNYYAWHHARWLVNTLVDRNREETEMLRAMIADVKDWCLKHHDDISGWTFLHYLLRKGGTGLNAERSGVFRGILQMAESFRWRNESVWWFIHAMASTELLTLEDTAVLEETGGRVFGGLGSGDSGDGVLSRKWFQRFRETRAI